MKPSAVWPDAASDPLTASERVARLIASAVAADPRWFWHGPDRA